MKKYVLIPLFAILSVVLISWGAVGHKTVATIAYNHLTQQSRGVVQALLGDTTMADVASWADEALRQAPYKSTAPRHYANVPLGLDYQAFSTEIKNQSQDNVYKAILENIEILKAGSSTIEERRIALKFIVHFVGDLHQPFHVSRAQDKGGNTIQVQFDGKGTNMHSLWDSKLIGKEGQTFEQMSIDYDKATPQQIKQWQSDDMMKWLYESYQISSKLYVEVEENNKLDDAYYTSHIAIVKERIEMAGIRLAGLLNSIFRAPVYNQKFPPMVKSEGKEAPSMINVGPQTSEAYPTIALEDAAQHIGEEVRVTAQIYGYKELGDMTLANLGAEYPNQLLTVVFKGDTNGMAKDLNGKRIVLRGKIEMYKGKPEIIVDNANQLTIVPVLKGSGRKGG
jgi:hypothetical protein